MRKGPMTAKENVPEVTNLWVNVYPNDACGHASREDADFWAEDDRVALLRLLIADGVLIDMAIEG